MFAGTNADFLHNISLKTNKETRNKTKSTYHTFHLSSREQTTRQLFSCILPELYHTQQIPTGTTEGVSFTALKSIPYCVNQTVPGSMLC